MCDTILAPPASTAGSATLFGKNSDRQRNEAQGVEYFARAEHAHGAEVTCTYISIPQARRTHAVLLCRPFWIWGAEMGANEHGVVIGNEGLSTRNPGPQTQALIGMDLLRLALERAASAAEAVDVITTLLARHGQGGNCGHLTPSYYHNGFMIADAHGGFVLETVDREWLVEPITGPHAISNRYSIERGQRTSPGLVALVRNAGWVAAPETCYADVLWDANREHIGHAGARLARAKALLLSRDGRLDSGDMMRILRDHGRDERDEEWSLDAPSRTICMHAGREDKPGQTVGSMVSEIHPEHAVHWVTGTSAPCISIFKPVLMGVPLPIQGPRPTDRFDPHSLWWRHERMHRAVVRRDFTTFHKEIREERDAVERQFRAQISEVLSGSVAERAHVVEQCWRRALEVEEGWFEAVRHRSPTAAREFDAAWTAMNRLAGLESS